MEIQRLAIVVPTYNRPKVLQLVWRSWLEQQGLEEIIVINDGSESDYSAVFSEIAEACSARQIRFKVLTMAQRAGAPAARNVGIAESNSNEILTTDDDIILAPDMVEACRDGKQGMEGHGVIIGARVIYVKDGETVEQAKARADGDEEPYFCPSTLTIRPWARGSGEIQQLPFVSAVALWPRALFQAGLRYFEGYGGNGYREETDPQIVAQKRFSARVYLAPDAVCYHLSPSQAYSEKSGQRRGGPVWFEWWVLKNNIKFYRRHHAWLKERHSVWPLMALFSLTANRLSISRIQRGLLAHLRRRRPTTTISE